MKVKSMTKNTMVSTVTVKAGMVNMDTVKMLCTIRKPNLTFQVQNTETALVSFLTMKESMKTDTRMVN